MTAARGTSAHPRAPRADSTAPVTLTNPELVPESLDLSGAAGEGCQRPSALSAFRAFGYFPVCTWDSRGVGL